MRKGVKLAGLLAAGVAAFAVACSPVCNPVPVADPHGTPEQQWNWWRETYATADYGQADLAGYTSLSDIPQCGMEDGSMAGGYERISGRTATGHAINQSNLIAREIIP